MRRFLASVGGALGGIALYRWATHRGPGPVLEPPAPPAPAPEAESDFESDPRAEELRRRLQESRAIVDERAAFEEAETPVDAVEPAEDPGERRRRVHEEGRAAAERMRGSAD
jgi:hypothetical protein